MDLRLLADPRFALRIEARIRVSHAPRRVNLHLNTQRTTDFHTHLMEFDIPDTAVWHVISMTTRGFDAFPGDSVYGQLALMDWGLKSYRVDIDYFRTDIVDTDSAGADSGAQVPYRPPLPDPAVFDQAVPVSQDCTIDSVYPDMRFNGWAAGDDRSGTRLLIVSSNQFVIMRWDLDRYRGRIAASSGLLDLSTFAVQRDPEYAKDFGMVRICEILGGEPFWTQEEVTFASFCRGEAWDAIINTQMIIDVTLYERRKSRNLITISRPVLQRILDGKTLGLAIRPLGAIHAAFYSMENSDRSLIPRLHFNLEPPRPGPGGKR
jgi:hypothetical protein